MPHDMTLRNGQGQDTPPNGDFANGPNTATAELLDETGAPVADESLNHAEAEVATHSQTATVQLVKDSATGDVPLRIGRYRIVRLVGQGTAGSVYEAFDELLTRRVAIKLQCESRATADVSEFQDEARTLAALEHPGIVPVYDYGVTLCGRCFVVSKLIEGTNLKDWMRRRRCSMVVAVDIVHAVAAALDYSHARGVIHRDVKPANLLVDPDDKVYVADFGIAVSLWEEVVQSGTTGSPAYMSPEQAAGSGARIDALTDVFSLGVVLYELLTGQRPFWGDTLDELTVAILNTEPMPPDSLRNDIPKELARVCLRALEKDSELRFQTATEFAEAARRALVDESTDKSPTRISARRWGVALAGSVLLGVVLLLGGLAILPLNEYSTSRSSPIAGTSSSDGIKALNGALPRGALWGLDEGAGALFVVEDLSTASDTTYARGPILWSDGRRVQPLGEGIDAMTFDGEDTAFIVCNVTVGQWRRPVLLRLKVSPGQADVARPIGSLAEAGEISGLAIHPKTGVLYGLEEDGTVFCIDRKTAATSNPRRIRIDDERLPNWESMAFDSTGRLYVLDDGDPKRIVALDVDQPNKLTQQRVWLLGHGVDEEWESLTLQQSSGHVVVSKTSGEGLIVSSLDQLPKYQSIPLPRGMVKDIEALNFAGP